MTNDVVRILSVAIARKASDIHLSVGRPPILTIEDPLEFIYPKRKAGVAS